MHMEDKKTENGLKWAHLLQGGLLSFAARPELSRLAACLSPLFPHMTLSGGPVLSPAPPRKSSPRWRNQRCEALLCFSFESTR